MRLSRPRVLLRAALLFAGSAFMLWRAWSSWSAAARLDPPERLLQERFALVWALVGILALGTGGVALLALRRRPRKHTLHLGAGTDEPRRRPGQ